MAATRFHQINRPQRLSDAVGSALEKRIRSGALTPGERLPTEAQLGAQFAVSRAVVREAVARLKAEGLVESRQGSGVFVATRPGAAAFRMNAGLPASAHDARDVFGEYSNVTDYEVIRRDIARLAGQYDIRKIGYDRWNSSQLVIDLLNDGLPMDGF